MRESTFARLLDETETDLAWSRTRWRATRTRLREWSGIGWPAGGEQTRSPGKSDPTPAAALSTDRDVVSIGLDLAELDEAITVMRSGAQRVRQILERHQLETPGPGKGEPGCVLCESTEGEGRKPHPDRWQKPHTRMLLPKLGTVPVCSFHYEWHQRYGWMPAPQINRWHLDHLGSRVPRQLIQDHHPLQWREYQQSLSRAKMGAGWVEGNTAMEVAG